jgi:hypothetical protein
MDEPNTAELRAAVLRLAVIVVVLDAAVIGAYYWLDIKDSSAQAQTRFVAVWLMLTLLAVAVGMRRVRAARLKSRRQP